MTLNASRIETVGADWQAQLAYVIETVRELSEQTDPQAMVHKYGERVRKTLPVDASLSLSRRGLKHPHYRITRSSRWSEVVNPWKQQERLPLHSGGLLSELIWSDEPHIIDDLQVAPDEPAAEYLQGYRSLVALPQYDGGVCLNMIILLRREPAAFAREDFPNLVLTSSLFGRATYNLVLSAELREAYEAVDSELKVIADIQRSLLPQSLPNIPTMEIATHYATAQRAGGDYYDFFELPEGRWGILIADVAGHGPPAAVLMAVTHSLAHALCVPQCSPSKMLTHLNERLCQRYTGIGGTFVTAMYAIYEPKTREITYASAGHPPPRLKRYADGSIFSLDGVGGLPLGIIPTEQYPENTALLTPGDQLIIYTDGITEAANPEGDMYGAERLDTVLEDCSLYASGLINRLLDSVEEFAAGRPRDDDQTVVVAKIS